MMQKMVSLPSGQPEGGLFLAAALPSLCIRKRHMENLVLLLTGFLQSDYTQCCFFADVTVSHPWLKAVPCPFVAEGRVTVPIQG